MLNQIEVELNIYSNRHIDDLWSEAVIQCLDNNVTMYNVDDSYTDDDGVVCIGITYFVDCYNTSLNDSDETVGRDVANRTNAYLLAIDGTCEVQEWSCQIK